MEDLENVSIEEYLKKGEKNWWEFFPVYGEVVFFGNLKKRRTTVFGNKPTSMEAIAFHMAHSFSFLYGIDYVIEGAFNAYNLLEKLF